MLNVGLAGQMVGFRDGGLRPERMSVREQLLTIPSYTIGIVQQQHHMQERLVRNQPTSLWALAPEPRRKEKDPPRAAEDSQPAAAINRK